MVKFRAKVQALDSMVEYGVNPDGKLVTAQDGIAILEESGELLEEAFNQNNLLRGHIPKTASKF